MVSNKILTFVLVVTVFVILGEIGYYFIVSTPKIKNQASIANSATASLKDQFVIPTIFPTPTIVPFDKRTAFVSRINYTVYIGKIFEISTKGGEIVKTGLVYELKLTIAGNDNQPVVFYFSKNDVALLKIFDLNNKLLDLNSLHTGDNIKIELTSEPRKDPNYNVTKLIITKI
jgi:hypothetical protein